MVDTNTTRVDGVSEKSLSLVEKPNYSEEGSEWKSTEKRKKAEESILRINRQKQRALMEANIEKDKRLQVLEKEVNGYKTQHKEGIYWLQLQLNSTRKEKNAADERIAELERELRHLALEKQSRKPSLDPTIVDSVGGEDDKDNLITQLRDRLQMYESSFGAMEDQMAMVKASSGEAIKTLKGEIANLMEDHTRSELELLNQLSELENENRKRQIEHTLELHDKDETIVALRNLATRNTSVNRHQGSASTLIYNESVCTENTKNSTHASEICSSHPANDGSTGLIQTGRHLSSLVLRLGEENADLQQKLEQANKELKDLQSAFKRKEKSKQVQERILDERRAVDLSLDMLKSTLGSTNEAVTELRRLFESLQISDTKKEKKKILSVLESASLIHEEVKLSILLTELKLRNEFECLKNNRLGDKAQDYKTLRKEQIINDLQKIQKDALIELEKAEAKFSGQMKDLERRVEGEKSNLENTIQRETQERGKKRGPKSCTLGNIHSEDGMHGLDRLLSFSDLDPRDATEISNDRINVSRGVLNLLEKELLQYAERIKAKNKKLGVLKQELHGYKSREKRLRKELRESVNRKRERGRGRTKADKIMTLKKFDDALKEIREKCEDDGMNSLLPKPIPREIHTTTGDQPTVSPVVSPFPSEHNRMTIKFKEELKRGRRGRSADSKDAGADPAIAPIHQLTPGERVESIRRISSLPDTKNNAKPIPPIKPTSKANMLGPQPDSRDTRKLLFLPPCFFEDLKRINVQ